jgi:hypothetical protein
MSKTAAPTITAEEHGGDAETRWTDAQIRWPDEEIDNSNNNDDDDSENYGAPIDPFQDPDPFDTFSFRFPHPSHSSSSSSTTSSITAAGEEVDDNNKNNNSNAFIDIALRGYKAESDQIWQSTGLTLWRAAEHLCDYLVNHVELLQNKRILEVS